MQHNDGSCCQTDFTGASSQGSITADFDHFGCPISAPTAAAAFDVSDSFWDVDTMALGSMDMDFTVPADLFQATLASPEITTTAVGYAHRQTCSFDWTQNPPDMFQRPSGTPAPPPPVVGTQEVANCTAPATNASTVPAPAPVPCPPATKKQTVRPIAPKPPATASSNAPTFVATTLAAQAQAEDPFTSSVSSGVFAGPPSSAPSTTFKSVAQAPVTLPVGWPDFIHASEQVAPKDPLRRSASTRETGTPQTQISRPQLGSPVKSGLRRSFSENKGRRPTHEASLPTFAPSLGLISPNKLIAAAPAPPIRSSKINIGGRKSPTEHKHRRLPSLSAIPESTPRDKRTDVKFVIDSHGRARVEPVIVNGEHVNCARNYHSQRPDRVSSDEGSSDTDDDPIIIPSRNTSFALPDPFEVKPSASFHASQRSISERRSRSLISPSGERGSSRDYGDSDNETLVNQGPAKLLGDAASELRKVMETRHLMRSIPGNEWKARTVSASLGDSLVSPTSTTNSNTSTPYSDGQTTVRCVCDSTRETDYEYMVQWYVSSSIQLYFPRAQPVLACLQPRSGV